MEVGFAGSGNMAAALARGWARASLRPASMLFTDSGSGRAESLAEGVEKAASAVDSGASRDLLERLVAATAEPRA